MRAERTVAVVENIQLARATYRIRLADPEMARAIRPGQFLMIRAGAGTVTCCLGRLPAAGDVVADAAGRAGLLDTATRIGGAGTARCAGAGQSAADGGPLGNGFGKPPARGGDVVFVAGGIGQTPFLALGRAWLGSAAYGAEGVVSAPVRSACLLYGVRSGDLAAGIEDFERAGITVELATDDGSAGHHGFVTELLARRIERGARPAHVVACGPPPMLAAVARMTARHGITCEVSLENHMACGFGACFSCVAPIRQGDGLDDSARLQVDGLPVLLARLTSCSSRRDDDNTAQRPPWARGSGQQAAWYA